MVMRSYCDKIERNQVRYSESKCRNWYKVNFPCWFMEDDYKIEQWLRTTIANKWSRPYTGTFYFKVADEGVLFSLTWMRSL